jgi:hypothetical protein
MHGARTSHPQSIFLGWNGVAPCTSVASVALW